VKATLEELSREGKTRRWRVRVDNGFDAPGKRDRHALTRTPSCAPRWTR
jgi:hypothetical protein